MEMGYNVIAVPPLRRNGPLRDAIARSGLARVMHRLHYQSIYMSDPFARDDLIYIIESYPMHLSHFGYSTDKDTEERMTALNSAATVYGIDRVIGRLAEIVCSGDYRFMRVLAEDVKNLEGEYEIEKDEIPLVLRELMRQFLPLSLRDYGYKMSLDRASRRCALLSAINEWGGDRVVWRLMEVSTWHKSKPVVKEDIAFCTYGVVA